MRFIFFCRSSGKYTLSEIAPNAIVTWQTTAIAVHPVSGLSVTPKAAEVSDRLYFGYRYGRDGPVQVVDVIQKRLIFEAKMRRKGQAVYKYGI